MVDLHVAVRRCRTTSSHSHRSISSPKQIESHQRERHGQKRYLAEIREWVCISYISQPASYYSLVFAFPSTVCLHVSVQENFFGLELLSDILYEQDIFLKCDSSSYGIIPFPIFYSPSMPVSNTPWFLFSFFLAHQPPGLPFLWITAYSCGLH